MKEAEALRAQMSAPMRLQAGSSACIHGVECFTLAWTAGLLAAFLHETAATVVLLLFGIAAACGRKPRERLLILLGAVLGIACWLRYDCTVRQPLLALDGEIVVCTGRITDTDALESDRMIYTLRTELAGQRVSVDWYADASVPRLNIGDTVTLDASLTYIRPDYRYHTAAYQAGFGKYLRIYSGTLQQTQAGEGFSMRRTIRAYRQQITAKIEAALPPEDAALLCAMIFGEKSDLSFETTEDMNRVGIGHIAAVSGLHLIFFCGVLGWLLRRMRLSAKAVCLLHIPAIMLFILLVDSSVSVYRAAVMVMLSQSAALFGRRGDTLRSLCLAMFLCTVFTPYVIGSVSFWLSVSGVFGIGVLAPFITNRLPYGEFTKNMIGLCCVAVAVFPASVLLCGESSLLSPLGNLLILPVCIAALYIGFFLLLSGGLTAFLLPAAGMLCRFARVAAHGLAKLPFSQVTVSAMPLRLAVVLLSGLLLLAMLHGLRPRRLAGAVLSAAVLLSLLSAGWTAQNASQLRIAVLGGSKQAALVISAQGSTVIADLSDNPRNAQYVRRYLHDAGITRADVLLLSGGKSASAYQEQLSAVKIGNVMLQNSSPWRKDATVCGAPVLWAGDSAVTIQCGAAALVLAERNARITWHDITVVTLHTDTDAASEAADAVIHYGREAECEISFPAAGQTVCGNDLLLRLTADGRSAVEWLE